MQLGMRTLVFLALLVVLGFASYLFLFKPREIEEQRARAETLAKQEKLAALEKSTAEVTDLPQEIAKLRKAIEIFESKLPEEKEMDKVLREIWQTAEQNGLNVKSVRNLTVVPGTDYSEQPIRMIITGSAMGFHQFLRSVDALPRITRINELNIDKDGPEGHMKAEFTLTIFFERSGRST